MQLLSPTEARSRIAKSIRSPGHRVVPPEQAIGRIIADDVVFTDPIPARPISAMDGYAVRARDTPGELECIGTASPAQSTPGVVGRGTCFQILTGAPLPEGADTVVPLEDVEGTKAHVRVRVPQVRAGACVVPAGAVRAAGSRIPTGTSVSPGMAATMLSVGIPGARVREPLHVRILPIGTEIVQGSVRDALSPILESHLNRLGCRVEREPAANDEPAELARRLRSSHPAESVILTTGGTGPSETDHVAGLKIGESLFDSLPVKPGRPTKAYVLKDGRVWIALPGNPSAALLIFRAIVVPALLEAMGQPASPASERGVVRVAATIPGHRERWRIAPVRVDANGIIPIPDGPSTSLGWWDSADGVVVVGPGQSIPAGGHAEVLWW